MIWFRAGLCLFAAVLLAGVVVQWPREYDSFFASQQSPLSWTIAPTRIALPQVGAVEGQYMFLERCDQVLGSRSLNVATPETRAQIAQTCLSYSESVLTRGPSLSLAHMVRGHALLVMEDNTTGFTALLAAEQTGGALTWMAARRFELIHPRFDIAPNPVRDLAARDIARLLFGSQRDIRRVASRYTRTNNDRLRQFIVDTVDTLPDTQQRRFLSAVRRLG